MQFPFDEPDDDADFRRFPCALAICVASVLLLALAGLWSLLSHRHQGAEAPEPVNASRDTVDQTAVDNDLKPTLQPAAHERFEMKDRLVYVRTSSRGPSSWADQDAVLPEWAKKYPESALEKDGAQGWEPYGQERVIQDVDTISFPEGRSKYIFHVFTRYHLRRKIPD